MSNAEAEHRIIVPSRLDTEAANQFAITLANLPDAARYVVDFEQLSHVEPFGMLFVATAIRRCREARPKSKFQATQFRHSYAAHMGFFKAFGLDYGNAPGDAAGSDTYLPLTRLTFANLRANAPEPYMHDGELIESHSKRLADVLTQSSQGDLHDVLTYSFREIIRNVAEHSTADGVEYCAQYWPSKSRVEVAILDCGCGMRSSLGRNPHLEIASDAHALQVGLLPGISGVAYKGGRRQRNDEWANSGYGLYMTSRICRYGGSFFICSDSAGLYLDAYGKSEVLTSIAGTAICMVIQTHNLGRLQDRLSQFRKDASELRKEYGGVLPTASTASQMLSRDFKSANKLRSRDHRHSAHPIRCHQDL